MADVYSALFIVQFFTIISIFFAQSYNLMSVGRLYDLKMGFILLFATIIAFGVGRSIAIIQYSETIIVQVFKLEIFLFLLCFGLFVISIVMELGLFGAKNAGRFNSKKQRASRV